MEIIMVSCNVNNGVIGFIIYNNGLWVNGIVYL